MGTATAHSIWARVVLYGPPCAQTSAMLGLISGRLKKGQKGELHTEERSGGPCDVLPVVLGEVMGLRTEFEFVAAPADWIHEKARADLLADADGLVFVASSREEDMPENEKSLEELQTLLKDFGKSLVTTPVVFHWAHQGEGALPPDALSAKLNPVRAPHFGSSEGDPQGVFDAFTTISKITLKKVREDLGIETGQSGMAVVAAETPIIRNDGGVDLPLLLRDEEGNELKIRVSVHVTNDES